MHKIEYYLLDIRSPNTPKEQTIILYVKKEVMIDRYIKFKIQMLSFFQVYYTIYNINAYWYTCVCNTNRSLHLV